jgi:hypothetical protein
MNIRNMEGYMDRTPFEAIKAVERNKLPHFSYHTYYYRIAVSISWVCSI